MTRLLFAAASLAATASAAAFPRGDASSCGFRIVSSGGVDGVMGQFEDGQNRINGSYAPATYHYNNGGIVDEAGRGCIVTLTNDATRQFQCDLNKPPTYGFTIAQNGSILYQGSDQFYACPYITEYNVYTQWLKGQDKCVPIKLSTNATCAAGSYSSGTAASYYPTGDVAGTGVPVVPGYSSEAPPFPSSSAGQSIPPTYGQSTGVVPAGSQSTSAATAPTYSQATVPAYGGGSSLSSASVPQYSSVETADTVPSYGGETSKASVPGYGSSSSAYVPGVSSVETAATVPGYGGQTSQISVPGYGSQTTPAASTPVETSPVVSTVPSVPQYSRGVESSVTPVESSVPSVPQYSTGIESTMETAPPAFSTPEESSPVESTPVPSASSVASYPSSAQSTVTILTTIITSECPETETAVSSGTTIYNTHQTRSVFTSVATSSVPAPSESIPAETPSSPVASVPVTSSTESVPGYGPAVGTLSVASESQSTSYPSFPAVMESVPAVSTPVVSTSVQSVSTTFATTWSVPAGNNSVPAPTGSTTSAFTSVPSGSTSATACQTSLSGAYQTPHLITWIAKDYPDTAYGSKYNASINEDCSSIMNFDIPREYEGKTCSIVFLFPKQEDLETSAWSWNNEGGIQFDSLSGVAIESTTYNTCPAKKETLNTIDIQAGNSYVVKTGACAAGSTESIELSSSNGLQLEFFEDWNPSSLGLYITAC
ncbi:hypothetical protein AC578_6082 [Pseudocercospora eumusae]|uniref:Uncharacterized protein n=1 Tax=Pseudocercospora eumusae TaxID=321146 RepID=A0A139HVE0_9PEZI|nr:hypothetical protein AC578_6082 [Pseudocercospora eumusae]